MTETHASPAVDGWGSQDALSLWVPRGVRRVLIIVFQPSSLPAHLASRGVDITLITPSNGEWPVLPAQASLFDTVIALGDPLKVSAPMRLLELTRAYCDFIAAATALLRPGGRLLIGQETLWSGPSRRRIGFLRWVRWRSIHHLQVRRALKRLPIDPIDHVALFPDLWRPVFLASLRAPALAKRLAVMHAGHTRWRRLLPVLFPFNRFFIGQHLAGGCLEVGVKRATP